TLDEPTLAGLVTKVCDDLSRQLLDDAEGADKRIVIDVTGAATEDEAVEVGRAVARSNLLKCAVHGADPNWGRVLAAVGTTSATFEPDQIDVAINDVWVCRSGAAAEPRSSVDMSGRAVSILVDLHAGNDSARIM